ncbi:hypothetical protein [Noviherbaspirillum pedocola]|uniref:Uncharacterized protein n=1 Tax=Noviherbaspirillum pedocola TaxID=2801341 RepID=A0A934SZY3_9BURK|nr:hypothetical protein [Noviherbaspirillum pedocola]MBK4738903.1 hypothetical protein [Noviherbaspirillum pedocola]
MINPTSLAPVYSAMIAGRVVNHSGDVDKSIFFIAREVLHTDKIHTLVSVDAKANQAYYFAVPSTALSQTGSFETPLAAAFPAHPEHAGDGAYYLERETFACAVIKDGESFQCLTNKSDVLLNHLRDLDLSIHRVDGAAPWRLESAVGRYRRFADGFSEKTIKLAASVTAVAAVVGFAAMLAHSVMSSHLKNTSAKATEQLNAIVMRIEHASPLSQQLAQFQKVSSTVVRAGGWIDAYQLKGNAETFSVSLPEWVTQDYIKALGQGTRADKDAKNNVIRVEK